MKIINYDEEASFTKKQINEARWGPLNKNIIEIIEINSWKFKVRSSTNRRKWYEVIWRRDATFWCSCPGFKFNSEKDKHIEAVKGMIL